MKTMLFILVLFTGVAHADYTCNIVALKSYPLEGSKVFYPTNVPAAAARTFVERHGFISADGISGSEFIVDTKKSYISMNVYIVGWNDSQEAKVSFQRKSLPNKYKVMTKTDDLGEVSLKGNDMKQIDILGGQYRVTVICNTNNN